MVYWPALINIFLLSWSFILPTIVDALLVYQWSIGALEWWVCLALCTIATPVLVFLGLYNWQWYSTEGAGPVG